MRERPILDDCAAIAAELRRVHVEKQPANDSLEAFREPAPHCIRATITGDLLYLQVVSHRHGTGEACDRIPIAPAQEADVIWTNRLTVHRGALSRLSSHGVSRGGAGGLN